MDIGFYKRLREFIEYKNLNINEFSRKTGFSSGALSKILKNQRSFGVDKLMNIFIIFPELRPQWLLSGKGDMLINPEVEATVTPERVATLERENLKLEAKVEALQEVIEHLMAKEYSSPFRT